jgi:hypothetical protein
MKTGKLTASSSDLRKRILTEVRSEDRLEGFNLRERTGPNPVTMCSFKEAVTLLNDSHPRLDFHELGRWVREVMDDAELAEQIAVVIKEGNNDQERTHLIRDLMEERLNQCPPEEYDEDHIG